MQKVKFYRSRRRTNTPIDNRLRVVAYRHRPVHTKPSIQKTTIRPVEHTNIATKNASVEVILNQVKDTAITLGHQAKNLFDQTLHKIKEQSKNRQQTKVEVKPVKTESKPTLSRKDKLNAQADTDMKRLTVSGLISVLFPAYTIDRLSKNHDTSMMLVSALVRNGIHWITLWYFLSSILAYYINLNPFSFTRMNFTDTAVMSFKLAFLCFVLEGLYFVILGLIANVRVKYNYRHLVASLTAISITLPSILFVLASIVLTRSFLVGLCIGVIAIVMDIYLHIQVLMKSAPFATTAQMIVLILMFVVFVVVGYFYVPITMQSTIEIFKTILNL